MKFENWLEYQVIKNADKIVLNTELLKKEYVAKYEGTILDKGIVITNGYDPDDFDKISTRAHSDGIFTISHVGEFYECTRTPDNFLKAVSELVREHKVTEKEMKINFVGGGDYVLTNQFEELINQLRLRSIVNIFPHIPHRESIEFMLNSDVLLLLQPDEKYKQQIPAKAFEYIKSGKYIFTLAPSGATADLVSAVQGEGVVAPEQINMIKNKMYELYIKFKNNGLQANETFAKINSYDRKQLTKDLCGVFRGLRHE
jgi:glycosyltransferase involved in cell wall biosynthesis